MDMKQIPNVESFQQTLRAKVILLATVSDLKDLITGMDDITHLITSYGRDLSDMYPAQLDEIRSEQFRIIAESTLPEDPEPLLA